MSPGLSEPPSFMGHLHPALKVPRVLQLKALASFHARRPSALSFLTPFDAFQQFQTLRSSPLPSKVEKDRSETTLGGYRRGR